MRSGDDNEAYLRLLHQLYNKFVYSCCGCVLLVAGVYCWLWVYRVDCGCVLLAVGVSCWLWVSFWLWVYLIGCECVLLAVSVSC